MKHGDTGPLVIASDVMSIAEDWDRFKEEAGGLTFSQWITREMGNKQRGLAFFRKRHEAVQKLGEDIRRTFHHEVAVYVVNSVPETAWFAIKSELRLACIRNSGTPRTMGQARPIINKILGRVAQQKTCANCDALARRVAELEARLRSEAKVEANAVLTE